MKEKVNPKHPEKIADRIAGAIVDLAYQTEKNPKISQQYHHQSTFTIS